MSIMTIHITPVATATATRAGTVSSSFAWATARVMTPVIVPGLAANKITGVIDCFSSRVIRVLLANDYILAAS
jgi:hypothetical protein